MTRSRFSLVARWQRLLWAVLAIVLLIALGVSGLRIVPPGEVALVYRLGRLVGDDATAVRQSGLLWTWPEPIDQVVLLASKRESQLDVVVFWPPHAEVEELPEDMDDAASVDEPAAEQSESQLEKGLENSPESAADNVPRESLADAPADSSADATVRARSGDASNRGEYSLTGDRGLVGLRITARYVIASPADFQRCAAAPRALVERMVARELQKAMLRSSLDEVLQQRVAWPRRINELLQAAEEQETRSRDVGNLADVVREEAQRSLEQMSSGVRLTSLEIRAARPPREVRAAFDLLQTARIEQETTQARMMALADEVLYDSESLARQALAEAKGNAELRKAEIARQIAMFDAELDGVRKLGRAAAMARLREQALRDIISQCERAYFVAEPPAGGQLRLRVSGEKERP